MKFVDGLCKATALTTVPLCDPHVASDNTVSHQEKKRSKIHNSTKFLKKMMSVNVWLVAVNTEVHVE